MRAVRPGAAFTGFALACASARRELAAARVARYRVLVVASAIRRLARGERHEAAMLLATAFAPDPLHAALFGADAGRRRAERLTFARFTLAATRISGGTIRAIAEAERIVAVCLTEPPGAPRWWRTGLLAARFVPVWWRLGSARVRLLRQVHACARALAPRAPHHYVTVLAVHPDAHRRGLASALIEHLAEEVRHHSASTGIALDTENPENTVVYEHLGFEVLGSGRAGPLTVTSFFRAREPGGPRPH